MRKKHPRWFNKSDRVPELGHNRYKPIPTFPLIADFDKVSTWMSVASLFRRVYPDSTQPGAYLLTTMQANGSVVIPGFYDWLKDDYDGQHPNGIMPMICDEFDMYEYHYQAEDGKPRVGWQRNMWHSLIQQLVRQDPAYYMLYVFFRPDHAWRLVSYPYYAKNTLPNEQTAFRHIDLNVRDFCDSGRGENILQGSMSLTDEDNANCTEFLPGMHKKDRLDAWWTDLATRGDLPDGYIQKIRPWMWTAADEAKYGTNWTPQPCKTGDVRLSLPSLPHGSTGPSTMIRRTVLPWFVAVQDDDTTLDNPESDNWWDLSDAHRDFLNASRTPSGLTSATMGSPPYPFPASTRLHTPGPISSCLVGYDKWSLRSVHPHLDILFGINERDAQTYIRDWRKLTLRSYEASFNDMEAAERAAFGKDSYFVRKDGGLLP
jgi:hypothetical protein